jgi:pimeloyl-ACP methyl ester carboxylesterase
MPLNGGVISYTKAGAGPVVLLSHDLAGTRRAWQHLIPGLARTHTVIVPDLPGHGLSDPPAGDYSLGAHASAMRDLLVTLGHARTRTVIHRRGQTVGAGQHLGLPREVPLLIARGVNDKTIPSHHHHGFAKRVPYAVMTQISAAGHYPHETAPAQLVETRHGVTPSPPGHVSSSDHQVRH